MKHFAMLIGHGVRLQRPAPVLWRHQRPRAPVVGVRLVEGVKPRHVLEGQQPLGAPRRLERQGHLSEILPDVLGRAAARDDADAVVQGPADHHGERRDALLGGDLLHGGVGVLGGNSI